MNISYGILKSPNCLNILNGNNVVTCPSTTSSKEPNIFTAKKLLEYCRLIVEPMKPEKPVGLSLIHVIANEPRFKERIIRRCELPLRINSKERKPHVQAIKHQKDNTVPLKSDSTTTFVHLYLEEKPKEELEQNSGTTMKPIQKYESADSETPMMVNDIKSFALLDAKFREDKERNFLNENLVMWNEGFIREIKPTYLEDTSKSCITKEECNKEKNAVGGSQIVMLESITQENSKEVIMWQRATIAKKSDAVSDSKKVVDLSPTLSKLKFVKQGKNMFKRERERGWRIRESFEIYKAKKESRLSTHVSPSSQCTSEVTSSKSVASDHPSVKAVASTWGMADVRNATAAKIRRNKEAEKRIRASFKTFVERQNQGRTLRALKDQ